MLSDNEVIDRILHHIDHNTTDMGEEDWLEPVENYHSLERFAAEQRLARHLPVPFCPTAALSETGSYVARIAAGTPLVVVKDEEGEIRGFRNACRHRGKQVALGSGTTKIFKCTYHGWAYRLDGRLEYIPGEHGFPNFDKACHGLVPVKVDVKGGLVFVTQDEPLANTILDDLPDMIPEDLGVFQTSEGVTDVNWKLNMEATMEGYHIKTTHPESFFPYGYDNLNVIEQIGPHGRVTFPFRRIERMRDVPPEERTVDRMLTYVYNVFPYATVAKLSNHTSVTISEPLTPTSTRFHLCKLGETREAGGVERAKKDASFLADTGLQEDNAAIREIQAGLFSGANEHFTYGRFQQAIVHFHKNLHRDLAALETLEAATTNPTTQKDRIACQQI